MSDIENLDVSEAWLQQLLASDNLGHGLGRAARALQEEISLQRYYQQGQADWADHSDKLDPTKLQIGGGAHELAGFLNVDIVPPADLLWDIREGLPFDDEVSELIFNEHCLEHLDYPTSVKSVVGEFFRVLKSGGQIIIGVPDAGKVMRAYAERDGNTLLEYRDRWYAKRNCLKHFNTAIDYVGYVTRDQEDDPKYHPHFWGYDFEKLESLLLNAGFGDVKHWVFDPTLANHKRQWGSIYVTATK